jgi:hypothetical protein
MPDERAGGPGSRGSTVAGLAGAVGPGSVDGRHLLLVGAGLVLAWLWPAASLWAATA